MADESVDHCGYTMRSYRLLAPLLMLAMVPVLHAEDPGAVLTRFKNASGGEHWDRVSTLTSTGTVSTGGLSGEFRATEDLKSGRSRTEYRLGPIDQARGYDGRVGWERAPGGEVATLNAPEALRRARTHAWLEAHGFWYPQRMHANYGRVSTTNLGGKHYFVIKATPENSDAVTLWFAADTDLLVRIEECRGAYTETTTLEDYRQVDSVLLPFHIVTDLTDSVGRTDSRRRTDVRLNAVTTNVAALDAEFAAPQMDTTARIDAPEGVTHVPFDLVNNHIFVDALIDGKRVRLLVDTGAVNLLTPAAAKSIGIAAEGKFATNGAGDKQADVSFARARELRVGEAVLPHPMLRVIDLGPLQRVEGVPVDGLLGYETFCRFGVTIDYEKHLLTLALPQHFNPPVGASAVPFELADRMPIITGQLDGLRVRLRVDTGSRVSLTLHSPFVINHDLVSRYRAAPDSMMGLGVGGPVRARPARLGALQIGALQINGIAGDLFIGDKGAFADPDWSGNLGGGVLRRFTVAFDYATKRIYLAPNATFHTPDAFDRSGLWLMVDGEALSVADVAKDSAAERAGLRSGDRILTLAGEAVSTRTLADWRRELREEPVGSKLVIKVQRDAQTREVSLVLADRIPETG